MTDFVDRLLGRYACSPIRPLLPTRYEPVAFAGAEEPLPMGIFSDSGGPDCAAGPAAAIRLPTPEPADAPPAAPRPPIPAHLATMASAAKATGNEHPPAAPRRAAAAPSTSPATPSVRLAADPPVSRAGRENPGLPAPPPARTAPTDALPTWRSATFVPASFSITDQEQFTQRPTAFRQTFVRERDHGREPDVHISIGRVEIKAAVPTGSPARRADNARRPQLTLDAYLKSRGS